MKKLLLGLVMTITLMGCSTARQAVASEDSISCRRHERVVYISANDGVVYFVVENWWTKQMYVRAVYVSNQPLND